MSIYCTTSSMSTAVRRQAYEAWVELGAELGFAPVIGIDPNQPATAIAAGLLARCGRRKSMWVRTRLNQLVEIQDGRRQHNGGGRPVVRANDAKPVITAVDHFRIAAE